MNEFRKLHRVFLEMDGNLLRKRLFGCDKRESAPPVSPVRMFRAFRFVSFFPRRPIYSTYSVCPDLTGARVFSV